METNKKIKRKIWIDGKFYPELWNFNQLAEQLIKESMSANGYTFRKKNKKAYVEEWFDYYLSIGGFDEETVYFEIANDIFEARNCCHKFIGHKLNKRFSQNIKYAISKKLESYV